MSESDSANRAGRSSQYVIIAIIFVNILMYVLMAMIFKSTSFSSDQLLKWGALWDYDVDNGQVWRIFTSNYIHVSISHILFNMLALYYWGNSLSSKFRASEMLWLYTLSGILGGIFSYIPHENIVSAGASGAISGLLGAMLVLHYKGSPEFDRAYIVQNIALNIFIAFIAPVDWKAHLGGFVGGVIWTAVRFNAKAVESDSNRPE